MRFTGLEYIFSPDLKGRLCELVPIKLRNSVPMSDG